MTREQMEELETVRLASALVDNAFYIQAMDKQLILIYDRGCNGLCQSFRRDRDLSDYIQHNTDEAYCSSIEKIHDNKFVLNVALAENYGNFMQENGCLADKGIINRALAIFMPVIQRFMIEAISNTLDASRFAVSRFHEHKAIR